MKPSATFLTNCKGVPFLRVSIILCLSFTCFHQAYSQCTVNSGNDTAVCKDSPLSLTAVTTGGSGINYSWNAIPATSPVNGNPFTVPTSFAGTFTYVVAAYIQSGCAAADTIITDTVVVTVNDLPAASFSFIPNNECASVPVNFTNTSQGIGLSYSWNFGDPNSGTSNTSTATSPSHRFVGTPGIGVETFTVTLIVTSSSGCKDTIEHQVSVKQSPGTQLGGTGQTTYNGLHYFKTCSTSSSALFNFTNQSSTVAVNTGYTIIWGDASPNFTATSFSTTSHTYSTGTYTLLFIVNGPAPNSCPDTATYYVFVGSNPAVGLNNPGNTTVCSGSPLTFPISGTFTNPPGTTYTVTFNDNSAPVLLSHPPPPGVTHAFTQSSCGTNSSDGTNSYTNSFSAVIVASNPCGTSSSGVVPIYVSQSPSASFIISPNDTVCTNNTVVFTNTSSGNSAENGVCFNGRGVWSISPSTGWTISSGTLGNDFGLTDPTTWLQGSNILRVNFTTVGTYSIKFKAGGSAWCNNDSITKTICVSAVPVAAFAADKVSGCAPLTVNTTNNSTASFCGNNRYTWSVAYTPTAGCTPGTPLYNFVNGTNTNSIHPQFEFLSPGVYTISLFATAPGGTCTSPVVTQQIVVKGKPELIFPPLALICENQSVSPVVTASCYTANATYAWSFPSGSPAGSTSQVPGPITYSTAGNYNISVNVTNECGTTSSSQPIAVNAVTAADAGPPQNLCGNTITMAGNAATIGTGAWSYVSGPNVPAITTPSSPSTTITGLIPGTYVFKWTITNGICVSSSNVTVIMSTGPTPANAGPDQDLCLATSVTMQGNTPSIGTGAWSFLNGPAGFAITDPQNSATTITGLIPGVYTFRWTTNFSNCNPSVDDVQVTIFDNPSQPDAGPDQTVCSSSISMSANVPSIGAGTWSLVSGPNNPAIVSPLSASTTIDGLVPGTYLFKWRISNGPCIPRDDTMQVIVTPEPTTAMAGPDQSICSATSATLQGNTPSIGTGQWTFISGTVTPAITDPSLPSTTITGLVPGTYIFEWSVSNGVCATSSDQVQIVINDNVTIANAGSNQDICGTNATMSGNVPVIGTGLWSWVSGPAGSMITTPTSPATTITGLTPGTYVFKWTITNGSCVSSSNVTIVIYAGPTPAVAGPDQDLCLATSVNLGANTPVIGTGNWTFINGPAGYTITDPSSPTTTATGLVPGVYTFRWTTTFSNCTPSTDDVQVSIFENPTVANAGTDQTICSSTVTMAGNVPTIGIGNWSTVSGPNTPNISNASSASTTITGLIPGTYVFKWKINNGPCVPTESNVTIIVTATPTAAAAGPDQVVCAANSTTLAGNPATMGTGSWTWISGPASYTITDPASYNTTITSLVIGTYVFQWTITNGVCPPSTDLVQVTVLNDLQNEIETSVTTICAGQTANITGLTPTGGTGTYNYQWEISSDGGVNWTNIPGATLQNYSGVLTTSACFRRKISSLPCEKFSNVICVTVNPAIANNTISSNQSICINTSAATLLGSTPTGGNNVYVYLWQQSTDGIIWTTAIGTNNTPDYSPGILTQTTLYRRIASTNLCNGPQANPSNAVTITVNRDSKAEFSGSPVTRCAPFNLGSVITVTPYPDRNGLYEWFAIVGSNQTSIGSNTTGVFPGYTINSPGSTVIIRLRTSSQFGCKPDSMDMPFNTITTAVAGFTKSPVSGCGPLTVSFTNTSNILNSSIQYSWNFGNGTTSNQMQPGPVTYANSVNFIDTTYYITLKAFNGCDTTYRYDSIKVLPNSKAAFGVDTTRGCSPFTIHITNTSRGNNTAYYWDFGDGQTDTTYSLGSFVHTYNTGAITNYTLTLISENQCTRDTQTITVVVSPNIIQPFVTANGNQLAGCAPHVVIFNNSSIGASQLVWDFGDGSPIIITPNNQSIIQHQYDNPGTYTVNLHLRNDCSDTLVQRTITVYAPPSASFNVNPIRVCTNQSVSVTNTSTNANAYQWIWGDATSSSFASGEHTYATPGTYTIALVATMVNSSGFACTDTNRKTITVVEKIRAQINIGPGKHCAPYTLNVNAGNISGFDLVQWFIYDSSSTQGVFHSNNLSASHVYTIPGTYSVKLIVRTAAGCIDSSLVQFEVFNTPKTSFNPDLIVTCSHDTTASFLATVIDNANNPVTYKWFVNGALEGTANPFVHRFQVPLNNTGPVEFIIQSLAENAAGCGDTSLAGKVVVQPLPNPHIEVTPGIVQSQPHYTFTFEDTVATNPNKSYNWDMGDQDKRNGMKITYTYGDAGTYKVNLLVTDFTTGCSARDSVKVTVLYVAGTLFVPNAFYPNSRINDVKTFKPVGIGLDTFHLQIFDAWGKLVFETTALNADGSPRDAWDGKYYGSSVPGTTSGSPLSQDAFVWKIVKAKFKNGKDWEGMSFNGAPPRRFGTLTLFR